MQVRDTALATKFQNVPRTAKISTPRLALAIGTKEREHGGVVKHSVAVLCNPTPR